LLSQQVCFRTIGNSTAVLNSPIAQPRQQLLQASNASRCGDVGGHTCRFVRLITEIPGEDGKFDALDKLSKSTEARKSSYCCSRKMARLLLGKESRNRTSNKVSKASI